ncbi:MAG TPA: tetratricopeptide repeat protein [Vicinamibacterales bacterium]|nr:tetratricopeptide repeat protein [Vicinamibacterales bacterium]
MSTRTGSRSIGLPRLVGALLLGVGVAALLVVSATLPSAQAPPTGQPLTPADLAEQALDTGRYDEVDPLLKGATDSRATTLRARAAIARGRYADAEKLLVPAAASAPSSEAALELGLLQQYLGRRQDARRTLQRVVDGAALRTAADFTRAGRAARALGQFKVANDEYFRRGARLAAGDVALNTAWGDLFLEKFDRQNALKSYQDALKADENDVAARVGLARVAAEGNPPAAREALEKALKTNPNYVPAHLLSAELALDDRRRDDAAGSIKKALEVNPNSLEAIALQAGAAFAANKPAEAEAFAQAALKINPTYGEVYRVVADHAARGYLFDEAATYVRKGLIVDPSNAQAYADLGMYLLRTGDEGEARVALERAFKDDPYNVSTFNSLDLLDTLDKFQTITDGDLVFKFHPDEVAVMREQAIPLAKEALAALSKRYQFTPKGPLLIEMFPKHDDFAVRTIGLPGMIGALGACFGRVVTLDSPRARTPGEFNWGETLWHELAHVITLQMSGNRVPRWLTEGVSVYEERRARPEWGKESDVSFAQALADGKAIKLDVLNEAFSDPKTISLAYYQASLVVDHLVQTYGEPALWKMLRAYGRGLETEDALKDAYGISIAQLQTSFDGYTDKNYSAIVRALKAPELKEKPSLDDLKKLAADNPESYRVHMALADALNTAGDKAGAIKTFERAAQLLPTANGRGNPHANIARIAEEQKDTDRAIRAYQAVLLIDNADIDSARKLAGLLEGKGDAAGTEDAYRRLVAADPFDNKGQTALGRLALKRKDTALALRSFRSALATKPADAAAAHADLAEALLATGQSAEAKRHTLEALEIAPSFERAQDLLLKIAESPGTK